MFFQGTVAHNKIRKLGLFGVSLALSFASYAQSQSDPLPDDKLAPVPTTWRLTNETWKLPAGETLGMVGGNLLFDMSDQVKLGVGSYGAMRGQRGGFITLGLAAELNQKITGQWSAETGLFVGGGGGRGSGALAGGGLMLRSHAGLSYDTQGFGKFGLGVSHVRFPSGTIQSTQPYLLYDYAFSSLFANGWLHAPSVTQPALNTLESKLQEFSLVYRHYSIPGSVVQDNGAAQHRSMQLTGAEWLSYLDDRWFLKLESEGAMGGKSNGYMQILVGAGYRLPLGPGTAVKMHFAAGPAGGGSVDTGGGLLLDGGIALQQKISRSKSLELSLGQVRSPSASFKANSVALKLSHHFGIPNADNDVSWISLASFEPQSLRMRIVNQTYLKGSPNWRNSYVDKSVSNLGVQLDYFLPGSNNATRVFATGQALAAYSGNAGAYMTGLIGAGVQTSLGSNWFAEAEGLVGAAGGGGLAVGGGLVGQANAGLGYRMTKSLSVMGTAGYMAAKGGEFKVKVLGVSLAYQFTGFAQK